MHSTCVQSDPRREQRTPICNTLVLLHLLHCVLHRYNGEYVQVSGDCAALAQQSSVRLLHVQRRLARMHALICTMLCVLSDVLLDYITSQFDARCTACIPYVVTHQQHCLQCTA
jgi:hypothetical protein